MPTPTPTQGADSLMCKAPRRIFPLVSLRILGGIIALLLLVALCVEQYLQHQTSASLLTTSWKQEDTRIKQNNLIKLAKLDPLFPLLTTPQGHVPLQSGKQHRLVVVGDSFAWGDGLANFNDVWWRQLERELLRRGYADVEVIALGRNGAQTKEELQWMQDPRFAALRPHAVLLGYVTNDPDMGLIPQTYKVYRMFFADDVFRAWLPELTEQFQAKYTHKESLRRATSNLEYGPEEWLLKLLEGENYRLYEETVAKLSAHWATQSVPLLLVTLPTSPDKAYFDARYEKPLRTFKANNLQVLNIIDDFAKDKGQMWKGTPLLWAANPANGHPGSGATLYYAQKVVDYLEAHAPEALGEKGPPIQSKARINDWYPWSIQARLSDSHRLSLNLPAYREMGVLPVGKAHVLVSFENPVPLHGLVVDSACGAKAEFFASVTDPTGLDTRDLYPLTPSGDGTRYTLPPLPAGSLVNTLRIVPQQESCELNAHLEFAQGVSP